MDARDRRRRAARGPAGHAIEVPRVRRRAERAVLGRRAHRELVHVRLAQDDRARVPQALGDVRVERRAIAHEDPRARRALAAAQRDQVLERDRDAEQRVERLERGRALGAGRGQPGVGGIGLGQRTLVVEREPRVQAGVRARARARWAAVTSRELTSPARSDAASSWAKRSVRASPRPRHRPVTRRRGSPGRRRSRRRAAGALARTSSGDIDGPATSSRRMFSSSIVWAVGGIASVSSSASFAYWSRMWLSWPSRRASSSVGQAEAREVRDVLDVGAGEGGHGPMIRAGPAIGRRGLSRRAGGDAPAPASGWRCTRPRLRHVDRAALVDVRLRRACGRGSRASAGPAGRR